MSIDGGRIGPYEIVREIGRGGMGVVYLARDTKLGREVAIKALPEEFATERERLARFETEARTLAALNHPNIATIHGLEEVDGAKYLVLEYVDGESLAERIARGPVPLDDALAICAQIAAGLEAAHDAGVVHRDLKPANAVIGSDEQVKILDFGLAKEVGGQGDASELPTISPTMISPATREGVILGTAAYMSPEQARGKAVDKRADVWAFGCVLYETLTGRVAFRGDTVSDTLAEILKSEPDSSILPSETPARIRDLLGRCLTKDPRQRMRDIGDARIEVERVRAGQRGMETGTMAPVAPAVPAWRRVLPWALVGVFGLVAGFSLVRPWGDVQERAAGATHVSVSLEEHPNPMQFNTYPDLAISRSGDRVVYSGVEDGTQRLYLRDLGSFTAVPLRGTELSWLPFFSPDGEWIGFASGGELKKIPLGGGAAITLAGDIGVLVGASWGPDGDIVYSPRYRGGLFVVPSDGGVPRQLTTPDPSRGEVSHRWPRHTPDGRSVVFTIKTLELESFDDAPIGVASVDGGDFRVIHQGGMRPTCTSSGHLLYAREGSLHAVPIDLRKMEVTGSPTVVTGGLITSWVNGRSAYDVSAGGTLVFAPGVPESPGGGLIWVDREGRTQWESEESRFFVDPRLSPDDRHVVASVEGPNADLWTYTFESATMNRLTFRQANNSSPAWSPDGRWIAFNSDRGGRHVLHRVPSDGSGPSEPIGGGQAGLSPQWVPDGESVVFMELRPETGYDIRMIAVAGDGEARDVLATPANEGEPAISPDGSWIAYISDESGRLEVYLRPFLRQGPKVRISRDGGAYPRWRRDGKELFFLSGNTLFAADIGPGPTPRVGTPEALCDSVAFIRGYDVSPDGSQVLTSVASSSQTVSRLDVILDWRAGLEAR